MSQKPESIEKRFVKCVSSSGLVLYFYTTDWSLEPFAIASDAGRLLQLVEHIMKVLILVSFFLQRCACIIGLEKPTQL